MKKVIERRGHLTAIARVPSQPFAERYKIVIERLLDDALSREMRKPIT